MNSNTFSYKVRLTDLNQNLMLSNKGLLNMLQEAANNASSLVGYGVNNIKETGSTWVLLYWKVQVDKRVEYNSEIKIKTWAYFSKKIYSMRFFEIYHNNELIAKAESKWVFVDAENHSIKKISDDIISLYGSNETEIFDKPFNDRIKFSENAIKVYDYQAMRRDLDANHHVNNNVFLEIANEALPEKISNIDFKNIAIVYKKELNFKDKVSCYYENIDNKHIIYLYNDTTDTYSSAIIFE